VTNEEEPAKLKADANTVDNASTADTANTANTADSHKVDPKKDRVP
jgi:BRCT domain type II-containing protein